MNSIQASQQEIFP